MRISSYRKSKPMCLLSTALFALSGTFGLAESHQCSTPAVIPLTTSEPPAKIYIDPPLPGPLASRGVAIISYCAENLHIAPVFGPGAATASPRVGHVHVNLDDAPWVWADASGNPIILQGLAPGPHKLLLTLVDANHHPLDKATITFVMPDKVEAHNGQ